LNIKNNLGKRVIEKSGRVVKNKFKGIQSKVHVKN
jgi:hypothetical protein